MQSDSRFAGILFVAAFVGIIPVCAAAEMDLLVSSFATDSILRYDGETGAFIEVFADGGGLDGPDGLRLGTDGNIYVSSAVSDEIKRYDGQEVRREWRIL